MDLGCRAQGSGLIRFSLICFSLELSMNKREVCFSLELFMNKKEVCLILPVILEIRLVGKMSVIKCTTNGFGMCNFSN